MSSRINRSCKTKQEISDTWFRFDLGRETEAWECHFSKLSVFTIALYRQTKIRTDSIFDASKHHDPMTSPMAGSWWFLGAPRLNFHLPIPDERMKQTSFLRAERVLETPRFQFLPVFSEPPSMSYQKLRKPKTIPENGTPILEFSTGVHIYKVCTGSTIKCDSSS